MSFSRLMSVFIWQISSGIIRKTHICSYFRRKLQLRHVLITKIEKPLMIKGWFTKKSYNNVKELFFISFVWINGLLLHATRCSNQKHWEKVWKIKITIMYFVLKLGGQDEISIGQFASHSRFSYQFFNLLTYT